MTNDHSWELECTVCGAQKVFVLRIPTFKGSSTPAAWLERIERDLAAAADKVMASANEWARQHEHGATQARGRA